MRIHKILLELERSGPTRAALRALRVLKTFTLQLPDGRRIGVGVDALAGEADSGDLASDLTDLLVATGEAARDRSAGLLLAIDEVQYLHSDELGALISAVHRTTQLSLPVVLVGAGLPQLPGLAGEAKSYAERLFDFPAIGSLSEEDARAALAIPAHDRGVDYTDAAFDAIVEESQGYPYAGETPISEDDVTSVRPIVLDQLDRNFFLVRADRLTPRERDYLRAMAELGTGPTDPATSQQCRA